MIKYFCIKLCTYVIIAFFFFSSVQLLCKGIQQVHKRYLRLIPSFYKKTIYSPRSVTSSGSVIKRHLKAAVSPERYIIQFPNISCYNKTYEYLVQMYQILSRRTILQFRNKMRRKIIMHAIMTLVQKLRGFAFTSIVRHLEQLYFTISSVH